MRWGLIKGYFRQQCQGRYKGHQSASRLNKGEQGVWQRPFWEHPIRDEVDFVRHDEYIHYNPVKRGLANSQMPGHIPAFIVAKNSAQTSIF